MTGKDTAEAPRIVHDVPGCVMALWRNVLIVIWGSAGTVALAEELRQASTTIVKAHPEGFSSLHFIVNGAGLPDSTARDELKKVAEQFAKQVACLGTVIDGKGFWASAIRSFFTGLVLFSRQPYKTHYAATIRDLAEWVVAPHAARTGVHLKSEDLARALSEVHARLRPAARSSRRPLAS
jgi:hypothetical protein